MEISAKVLREVEFSGSLRGYNTDEVDEFLEQVALAVDSLQAETRAAVERAEQAEQGRPERVPVDDDDSIRRTLVLAQRTADLAIKEAQEEAAQLLERARADAESVIAEAREGAERIGSDAERRLRDEVTRLTRLRDELRDEAHTLASLLAAERERLTESLGTALRYVEKSLTPAPEMAGVAVRDASEPDGSVMGGSDGVSGPLGDNRREMDDLEAAIAEDAAAAAPSRPGEADGTYVPDGSRPGAATYERPNLTALPALDDPAHDTAAWRAASSRQADWPA